MVYVHASGATRIDWSECTVSSRQRRWRDGLSQCEGGRSTAWVTLFAAHIHENRYRHRGRTPYTEGNMTHAHPRLYQGEHDIAQLVSLFAACEAVDQLGRTTTAADLAHELAAP